MKKQNVNNEEMNMEAPAELVPAAAPAEIATDNNNSLLVGESRRQTFSSWTPTTMAERKLYYNAINMPGKKLAESVNLVINVKHIYAETCEYKDKETGELTPGVRIVLIDDEGNSYNTSSIGIYNCLSKIFQIFGTPDQWESPLPLRVKQIAPEPNKKVLLLEVE